MRVPRGPAVVAVTAVTTALALSACGGGLRPYVDVPRSPAPPAQVVVAHCPADGAGLGAGGVAPVGGPVPGSVPSSFAATEVLRCRIAPQPVGKRRDQRRNYAVEEVAPVTPAFLSSLALPDQDFHLGDHGACPAVATSPVFVLLVDAHRHAVRPVLPEEPCGEPRAEVSDALDGLHFSVVREFSYRGSAAEAVDEEEVVRLLLTSAGITNPSLEAALAELLGKPVAESRALAIPSGIYPFPGGMDYAADWLRGGMSPLCGLGWRSLGLLELSALPSVDEDVWVPAVQESDALLVWGGDPLYLAHWMRQSRFAELLPSLRPELVYVGVSAGAIVASSTFGETYLSPPVGTRSPLRCEDIVVDTPRGHLEMTFATGQGLGLVDVALIPHFGEEGHADASGANAELWAARLPVPTYAIDDQTALQVVDGSVEVVSEGRWQLFPPGR